MATAEERNIKILIQTETNKAVSEVKRLNTEINRLQKQQDKFKQTSANVQQMSRSFASLATHVGKLAVIYGGFQGLQTTVRTFAEFEQSITKLGVVSGATEGELKQLEDRALDLGETTIYSASQVAEGLNSMAMAGLDAKEQMAGISSVLSLATIGMIGLDEASLIAVRTMNAFGLEAQDISTITDVMATGATDSAQTITELGNAYEKVGSVATAFGHSLEETTSALEIMADAGRVGSEAGTQLKIVMSRLAGNKEALKYITSLGISMYDAQGKLLPFKDQLVLLKGELGKLDEKSRNIKLGEIFGEEGKASAIVLLNNMDKYDAKLAKLNNSVGSAKKNAKDMQDTLLGSYKALTSALDGLAIKIGNGLNPALRKIIDDATNFILSLDEDEIDKFSESVAEAIDILSGMAEMFVSILKYTAKIAGSFEDLTSINAGYAVGLGVLLYKMRGVIEVMGKMHIATKALTAVVGTALYIMEKADRNWANFNNTLAKTEEIVKESSEAFREASKSLDEWDLTKVNTALEENAKMLKKIPVEIQSIKDQLSVYDDMVYKTDEVKKVTATLNEKLKVLENQLLLEGETTKKLTGLNVKLTEARRKEIDAINATRSSANQLGKDAIKVEGEIQKELDKTIEKLEKRKATLETTLGTMATKERKYIDAVTKAENDLAQLRQTHSNNRALLELSYEAKVANIRNKGLSDLQVYNNNQKRADEVLYKSKQAFAQGNYELAKKYLDEYDNLVMQSAGDEISHTIKVRGAKKKNGEYEIIDKKIVDKTIAQTRTEALKDIKVGHDLRKQYNDATNAIEITAQQEILAGEKLKLETLRVQMDLQRQMLALIGQMVADAKGIEYEPDLDKFNASMIKIDAQIEAITAKQREIKIDGNTKSVEQDIDNVTKETGVVVGVTTSGTEDAKAEINNLDDKKPVVKVVRADMTEAEQALVVWTSTAEQDTVAKHLANANLANATINDFRSKAQQNTYSTHYVNVITQGGYNQGGLITPNLSLPRFADGGHLDDGVGHSVKTGKLSGYGGGDKVKALLEAGEFIVKKEAVKSLGLDRLHQINQGKLPRFKDGGQIPSMQRFSTGGTVSNSDISSSKQVNINLNLGGKTYKMFSDEDVANALERYTRKNL